MKKTVSYYRKRLEGNPKIILVLYSWYVIIEAGFRFKLFLKKVYYKTIFNTIKYQIKNYKKLGME